jgi:hypothetical protein
MPKGPRREKRPADVIGNAVTMMRGVDVLWLVRPQLALLVKVPPAVAGMRPGHNPDHDSEGMSLRGLTLSFREFGIRDGPQLPGDRGEQIKSLEARSHVWRSFPGELRCL